jgi:hypothetical protein
VNRPITFQTRELVRLRLAMARNDTPETRAAYLRHEAARIDAEAEALLTGGPVT